MINVDVLVIGGGTAGSNAARSAIKAGAEKVFMVHKANLTNTCVEEGCMPSKSVLAAGHAKLSLEKTLSERDAHIDRLHKALLDGFSTEKFEVVIGDATFTPEGNIEVTDNDTKTVYQTESVVIATGSHAFVPPIKGLNELGDKMLISEDVVSKRAQFTTVPKRVLTIGGGPIGLETSTFFHDMGSEVDLLQRDMALGLFDPEFGVERVRASMDKDSFPIHLNCSLIEAKLQGDQVICTIENNGETREELYDAIVVATGRKANLDSIGLEHTTVERDDRGNVVHNDEMETSQKGVFIAGDVTGHHQILHYAAEMAKVAGHNAVAKENKKQMDYDKHMLAVSFDQFPSALIGLTQKEAEKRGVEVATATKNFNSIGLGILKRQEYGIWKIVAEKSTGKIIGSQILGPDSSGELIQILVPIIANGNTCEEVMNMTWYHPTYAEILKSLVRDIYNQD